MDLAGNHYEKAFESWLKDNGVQYLFVDQQKRAAFSKSKIKSFDFLFYTQGGAYLAEIKGRKFEGKTFTAFGSLPNWVTVDDVKGLENWGEIFGEKYRGLFIFVYNLENIDVDADGREIYEYLDGRYVFIGILLDEYKKGATVRSKKWKTVHLSAEYFKSRSIRLDELICRKVRL
ncbi:MAG: HYExAFE family protein [Phycisphaerae bacterium]|nr:HYExAFE family protein [Phycisphaerae bacterium]